MALDPVLSCLAPAAAGPGPSPERGGPSSRRERASPSHRRLLRSSECVLVFFVLPLALYFVRARLAFRIVPLVAFAAFTMASWLIRHPTFDTSKLWSVRELGRSVGPILLAFVPLGALLALWTRLVLPERFLAFPQGGAGTWAAFLAVYPLLAAYPQEIVFRGFFFHRYRDLFPTTLAMLAASSLSFGLAHLLYGNWIAPVLSGLGGLVFGYRYLRSGSVVVAAVEHGLWGNFLFTVGLGWYFYSGSIN